MELRVLNVCIVLLLVMLLCKVFQSPTPQTEIHSDFCVVSSFFLSSTMCWNKALKPVYNKGFGNSESYALYITIATLYLTVST